MSLTVGDLMNLPSLRSAELLAGKSGLSRIVSSVSVLEYADPNYLNDSLFNNSEFYGSEIVITAFANIKDNVDAQCASMRRLAEAGEAGIVLYYVGVFMPEVDERLIALGDALDFPLICMPRDRLDYRYSELISDVMAAIYRNQDSEASLLTEILERVSRLPAHQRTIDAVLKMLSDRVRSSVILSDGKGNLLNIAAWPRTMAVAIAEQFERLHELPPEGERPASLPGFPQHNLYRFTITSELTGGMNLLLLKDSGELSSNDLRQAAELVQLAINIWGQHHARVAVTELVRAIMQDEPIKMRRLADIFRVDVVSINTMWILHCRDDSEKGRLSRAVNSFKGSASAYSSIVLADIYEGDLLLFTNGPDSLQDSEALCASLLSFFPEGSVSLTKCGGLRDTTDVRGSFLLNLENLSDTGKVFPGRNFYTLSELQFTKSCKEQIAQGEAGIQSALMTLAPLRTARDSAELISTLSSYLLDCQSSVTLTAEALFLHKNTIKYRLGHISDLLGFKIGRLPESLEVYRAVALLRLLS